VNRSFHLVQDRSGRVDHSRRRAALPGDRVRDIYRLAQSVNGVDVIVPVIPIGASIQDEERHGSTIMDWTGYPWTRLPGVI
jgi:hypothetical protein